jgi:thioredoxin reductase (NADPH)
VTTPSIFAVDSREVALRELVGALAGRYGADYEVVGERSPAAGLERLAAANRAGREVALVLARQWMPEMAGVDFLARARALCPGAKRALMIDFGDASPTEPILRATALGDLDDYIPTPWESPDEWLYPQVQELLTEWVRANHPHFASIRVIGDRWSARSHELRDLLSRNALPYRFQDKDSAAGRALLGELGLDDSRLPVVSVRGRPALIDPTNSEVADAIGASTRPRAGAYDVAIIGAGPAGLAAAVYAASEGLSAAVVEREAIGGQAGSSSMIRNYLGFPRGIGGGELASRAYQQAWRFGADFVFTRSATGLDVGGRDHVVRLSDGGDLVSRAVVIATGVSYRRLEAAGVAELTGRGVFYGAATAEAQAMAGREVFVVGGANSAGQAAVHLAKYAARVTLVVRADSLARGMSAYLVREIRRTGNIALRLSARVVAAHGAGRIEALTVEDTSTGARETVPAAALFVLIGAEPHTDWLAGALERDGRGYVLTGRDLLRDGATPPAWPLSRPPDLLETSVPGVFAVGDVRHRSMKRVASAVGEGAIAIHLVHEYLGAL